MIVLTNGIFGKFLNLKDPALMNGISTLMEEITGTVNLLLLPEA